MAKKVPPIQLIIPIPLADAHQRLNQLDSTGFFALWGTEIQWTAINPNHSYSFYLNRPAGRFTLHVYGTLEAQFTNVSLVTYQIKKGILYPIYRVIFLLLGLLFTFIGLMTSVEGFLAGLLWLCGIPLLMTITMESAIKKLQRDIAKVLLDESH